MDRVHEWTTRTIALPAIVLWIAATAIFPATTSAQDAPAPAVDPAAQPGMLRAKNLAARKRAKPAAAATPEAGVAAPARPGPPQEQSADEFAGVPQAKPLETGLEYKPPRRGERFTFNLVDADLIELVKIIGNITGKSFILGGKAPPIKATIYAPTKITAEEAYRAFLSVLQVNGLTVIPSGKYLKILPVGGATSENTPILTAVPGRDQIVTRLHQFEHVSAEELAPTLDRFKSKDGDLTVYAPTNTMIITDYGTSIQRLVKLIALLDVPGSSSQIWIEPIHHADAAELATRITEIFEVGAGSGSKAGAKGPRKPANPPLSTSRGEQPAPASGPPMGDVRDGVAITKILADERTNSLIIIASESAYLRILELIKVLDVPIEGEGTMHVHKLQHASAEELAKTLSTLSKKGSSSGKGKGAGAGEMFEGQMDISSDKATNSLVIVSTLRDYAALKGVIDKLDTMQRQVFVEAVIMEVGLQKNKELGLSIHGGTMVGSGDEQSLIYGVSAPPGSPTSLGIDPTALTGLAAGVRGPDIPNSEGMVGFSVPAFGVALQALQKNTDVNVLSSPHILATDNVEAVITVGENVPVLQGVNSGAQLLSSLAGGSTSSAANTLVNAGGIGSMMSSYTRQDVGISLKITPHINDDSQVRIEVDLEISEVKDVDPVSGPTISKESAKTTSVVADQQTLVLGGLITDATVETTTKVPVLGDIPLIGALFRHKESITRKRNLIIFLTPYIIRNADDFREIFERKMAERREFIERYTAFEYHRFDPHLDWSRTEGAVTVIEKVLAEAEESSRLNKLVSGEKDQEHRPRKPLNFDSDAPAPEADSESAPSEETDVAPEKPISRSPVQSESLGGGPVVVTVVEDKKVQDNPGAAVE